MKTFFRLVCVSVALVCPATGEDIFNFAGYTFDQRNTPNQAARLGNSSVLGGAQFSPGLPSTVTSGTIPNFPQGGTGFNTALSLPQLCGMSTGMRAVNLPNGDNGITTRHGIEVWWTAHRGLPNLAGEDFVLYESASTNTSVQGIMFRARIAPASFSQIERWTPWHYYPPDSFQLTSGTAGLFAFGLDLSDMGVEFGEVVDRIQMANLIEADRVAGVGHLASSGRMVGVGRVVFDGSTNVYPSAGTYDADETFSSNGFDPDPAYLAVLHNVATLRPLFTFITRQGNNIALSAATPPGRWRVESTDSYTVTNWQLMESFTNTFGGGVSFVDFGQNGRPIPRTIFNRFYRIVSD